MSIDDAGFIYSKDALEVYISSILAWVTSIAIHNRPEESPTLANRQKGNGIVSR